jgi:cytoskeletal protein CcmA (bactofilin family)
MAAGRWGKSTGPGVMFFKTKEPSMIKADLVVNGGLVSKGSVQIDGKVEGDIRVTRLTIGEKATILGDVYAEETTVRGRIEGSIMARKVHLCATCHVKGNIVFKILSVEANAHFEGNCQPADNPLARANEAEALPSIQAQGAIPIGTSERRPAMARAVYGPI